MHGGSAPQVKDKAEERLKALQAPAITRLGQLVEQTEYPSVAIAAVKDVLDRTLGRAIETQNVNVSGEIDIVTILRQRQAKRLTAGEP